MIRNIAALSLLVMLGVGPGAAAPDPVTMNVTMVDYKFMPDHPVSYTHLDVYKRQVMARAKIGGQSATAR